VNVFCISLWFQWNLKTERERGSPSASCLNSFSLEVTSFNVSEVDSPPWPVGFLWAHYLQWWFDQEGILPDKTLPRKLGTWLRLAASPPGLQLFMHGEKPTHVPTTGEAVVFLRSVAKGFKWVFFIIIGQMKGLPRCIQKVIESGQP
jgi:hypothetical protein